MSKVFFTGCTHFDHENIIGLANRPFQDVNEMNHMLVENWNKVVGPNDEVFHLGDVVYGNITQPTGYWMGKLKGRKHLILGNHDYHSPWDPSGGFNSINKYLDINRKGQHFVLFHYPMEDWDRRYRGSIHLHAHTHQTKLERPLLPHSAESGLSLPDRYPADLLCNRFHVGVDSTNFTPISMDEIIERSKGR